MRSILIRSCIVMGFAASLAGAPACSRAVQAGEGGPLMTFTNESIDKATVYVVWPGGDLRRITSVMPGRTETLSLPSSITSANTVTIVAVPAAGNQIVSSGPISIGPGDRFALKLNMSGTVLSVLPGRVP